MVVWGTEGQASNLVAPTSTTALKPTHRLLRRVRTVLTGLALGCRPTLHLKSKKWPGAGLKELAHKADGVTYRSEADSLSPDLGHLCALSRRGRASHTAETLHRRQ